MWLGETRRRLLYLLRRRQYAEELDEEMRLHRELGAEANLEAGMAPELALLATRRRFGNSVLLAEASREAWGWSSLERLMRDLRYAFRLLLRDRAFTIVVLLVLALGIGANTTIFSALHALILNPFPFPQQERVVSIQALHSRGQNQGTGYRDFLDWSEQSTLFTGMAIWPETRVRVLTGQDEPQRLRVAVTTHTFASVAGVHPVLGRFFNASEDRPHAPKVVLLTYKTWLDRFGRSPDVIGKTMLLDENPHTVIGVLPASLVLPGMRPCEMWAPLADSPNSGRFQHQYGVIARLRPGASLSQAQSEMKAICRRLELEHPESNSGWTARVMPVGEELAKEAGTSVLVLSVAVAFVLLLACANVAGLMLARTSGRAREIAIRASLGASRSRLVSQVLIESLLLSVAAGAIGVLVARWLIGVIHAATAESGLNEVLRLNGTVLGYALAVSLATGLLFGLAPAWQCTRLDLNSVIKAGGRVRTGSRGRSRLLSGLVVAEIALSLALLAGAGLLAKDLAKLLRTDTGFRTGNLLTFTVQLPDLRYPTPGRSRQFFSSLLERLRTAPQVVSAAAVDQLPMGGSNSGGGFEIEGRPKPSDWMDMNAQHLTSTPGYFETLGIPLLRGRDFSESDSAAGPRVAIIDANFARTYFGGEDPLGRRIRLGESRTIVGVAGAVLHNGPGRPRELGGGSQIYVPLSQAGDRVMTIVVRTAGDPMQLAAIARSAVRELDASLPVVGLRSMEQVQADSMSDSRLITGFLGAFAAFALALGAIGVYGVIAYSVAERTHEIGVRVALGATRAGIAALVLRRGVRLAALGTLLGLPLALWVARLTGSLLHGVEPHDPAVFAAAVLTLAVAAVAASYLPARSAARVDPQRALSCD